MPHHHRNRPQGFTLIELLVVVAIISLLISILLPSLSRARTMARMVKCSANLKQFGTAHEMYANENGDYYVPLRSGGSRVRWYQNLRWRSMMSLRQGRGYPEGLICPDVPSDRAELSHNAPWSYGMNQSRQSNRPDRTPQLEPNMPYSLGDRRYTDVRTGTGTLYRIHRSKVTQPSGKLFIIDASDWRTTRVNSDFYTRWDLFPESRRNTPWSSPFARQSSYRHVEAANVLMFDGHVETRPKAEVWFVNANGGARTTVTRRLWFHYMK